jgi:peptidyl-prolyl cis-trans isomerase A (cyclophilin A)
MNENKSIYLRLLLLIIVFSGACNHQSHPVKITIQTSLGNIQAELYRDKAPVTCDNFLKYIDLVGDDGGEFYRTVTPVNQPDNKIKIEVLQGGFTLSDLDTLKITPIPLERTSATGILHKDGTLSMARDGPDSGTTEFFICIGDQPSLDFGGARNPDGQGFAAFGRVTNGMEIVRRIQSAPAVGQTISPSVRILFFFRN